MTPPVPPDLGIPGLSDPVQIGTGGFAVVYRAFQPTFKRSVAVKVLTVEVDDQARRRFERECEALGALSEHPGIVTVHDAGFTSAGQPYLVMAYLAGGSLAERVTATGPLGWETTLRLGIQLAGALAAAHDAGVIHCDLKPANVLTTSSGTPQLGDFGIARIAGEQTGHTSGVTASFQYVPPEVVHGHPPTPSSDIYSFGATLYELIGGVPAFPTGPDETLASLVRRVLEEQPADLRAAGAPDQVAELIEATMAKEPARRPQSAAQLAQVLQDLSRRLDVQPAQDVSGPQTAPGAQGEDLSATALVRPVTSDTAVRDASYATVASPAAHYQPTHRAPWTGMHAWSGPDLRLPVVAILDPALDVGVLGWHGDWAHIRCSNGWEAWVDGRLLVPFW